MKRSWTVIAGLLVAASAVCSCGSESASGSGRSGPPAPVVAVAKVDRERIAPRAELLGQLVADESVEIRPEISGIVATVEFLEGADVSAGQVLFRLRADEQRARFAEAEAAVAKAEDIFRRIEALAKAKTEAESQVVRARADYEEAKAGLELARVELDRTEIRAPFDGIAGARRVSPGAWVTPDDTLVDVQATDRLKLVFTLPEQSIAGLSADVALWVSVAPFPGERFPARIFFVAPGLDPSTRRLLVKAIVANPERRLRPGLFAEVEAEVTDAGERIVVPEAALMYGHDATYLWRVDASNVAQRVNVEVGVRDDKRVEIRSGLEVGDTIVVAGTNKVSDGMTIQPIPASAPGATIESSVGAASAVVPNVEPGADADESEDGGGQASSHPDGRS